MGYGDMVRCWVGARGTGPGLTGTPPERVRNHEFGKNKGKPRKSWNSPKIMEFSENHGISQNFSEFLRVTQKCTELLRNVQSYSEMYRVGHSEAPSGSQ